MSLQEITDWFIPAAAAAEATIYPGPRELPVDMLPLAQRLLELAKAASETHLDYTIEVDGVRLRGHKQGTVGGVIHILRRTRKLQAIGDLRIPGDIVSIVCNESFGRNGGLVLVAGSPGHGKSTSCAAFVMERVTRFGAFCLTVEDPPEFPLNGNHPALGGKLGKVVQVAADQHSYPDDLRAALRCYPSNQTGAMLLVGETRDASTAGQLLRAAINGHLVFTTIHAGEITSALERLLALARGVMGAEEASVLLAQSLRCVLHQKIVNGRLQMSHLFSASPDSAVGATIKRGSNLSMLSTEMETQAAQQRAHTLFSSVVGAGAVGASPGAPSGGMSVSLKK